MKANLLMELYSTVPLNQGKPIEFAVNGVIQRLDGSLTTYEYRQ